MGRSPSAATIVAGVIGSPIRHSLSPAIVGAAFEALDLDWTFVAFDVAPGGAAGALDAMRSLGLGGLSVTMPHKDDVAAAVDRLTSRAARLGTANCVFRDGDELIGDSTDGEGLVASLASDGISLEREVVAVIGAGGAARSIAAAAADAGATEVRVLARRPDQAAVAAALAGGIGSSRVLADPDALDGVGVVVNATPVGMGAPAGAGGPVPVDPDRVPAAAVAVDIVYHPRRTAWMEALAARGVRVVDGLGMLVGQAQLAVELWTGQRPPIAPMRAAAEEALDRRG